jgi:hypothetical protein
MRPRKDTNPLAIPLLAGLAILVLWPISYFFGIGHDAFMWALTTFAFYGGAIVLTLVVFGILYCVGWFATFVQASLKPPSREP